MLNGLMFTGQQSHGLPFLQKSAGDPVVPQFPRGCHPQSLDTHVPSPENRKVLGAPVERRFRQTEKNRRFPLGLFYGFGVILLNAFFQVRTRGSIKRRPPSRRFRRSQSDCGELGDFGAAEPSQENGAQEENGDEVFPSRGKAPGSPPPGEGAVGREGTGDPGSHEEPPLRRVSSRTETQEQEGRAPEEGPQPEKAARDAQEEATEPPPASRAEAENGRGSPREEGGQMEESTEVEEERAGGAEEEPGQKSHDRKPLEEAAEEQHTPRVSPGGAEAGLTPEEGKGKEKQDERPGLEPGCHPRTGPAQEETSSEVPQTEVGGLAHCSREGRPRARVSLCHTRCFLWSHHRSAQCQRRGIETGCLSW